MNSIRTVMRRGMLGVVFLACAVATAGAQSARDSSDVPDKWFGLGAQTALAMWPLPVAQVWRLSGDAHFAAPLPQPLIVPLSGMLFMVNASVRMEMW